MNYVVMDVESCRIHAEASDREEANRTARKIQGLMGWGMVVLKLSEEQELKIVENSLTSHVV